MGVSSRHILSIDPGLRQLGWAIISTSPPRIIAPGVADEVTLGPHGLVRRPRGMSSKHALDRQTSAVLELLFQFPDVTELWVENFVPRTPRKGMMRNIQLVGALITLPRTIRTRTGDLISVAVGPATWKGWIQKAGKAGCVREAVRNLLPSAPERLSDHEYDAIGLGLYAADRGRPDEAEEAA